jgi:hypothetical protein
MFDAIKQSLSSADSKEKNGNGLYKEILKFTPGNTYQVRLVPNPNSPKETIFHYYNHGWNSNATGKFVTALCPTTFGESCPIDAYYLKTYRTGTESERESAKVLSRKEGWMVNVYVVSDPEHPENEGKVKILRYGKELAKIIESALEGDDAQEFGVEKVFDVENGSTLRIKCENRTNARGGKAQYVTYSSSKFLSPSKLDVKVDDVFSSVHDLKAVNKQTTPAEMQRLLDEHFFNLTTGSAPDDNDDETTDVRSFRDPVSDAKIVSSNNTIERTYEDSADEETDESTDEKLKKLLADL